MIMKISCDSLGNVLSRAVKYLSNHKIPSEYTSINDYDKICAEYEDTNNYIEITEETGKIMGVFFSAIVYSCLYGVESNWSSDVDFLVEFFETNKIYHILTKTQRRLLWKVISSNLESHSNFKFSYFNPDNRYIVDTKSGSTIKSILIDGSFFSYKFKPIENIIQFKKDVY